MITPDEIHNFHVPRVRARLQKEHPPEILEQIREAHRRHHGEGTDAKAEADRINEQID